MFIAISGVSLPSFLVAAMAIVLFSVKVGWFSAIYMEDDPMRFFLPTLVLGLRPAAIIARLTRSSVLEVLYLDYVRTARAKGLHPNRVLYIHVLRNALVPVITVLGPLTAQVLTGSFIIERVFSVPGLASHFIEAVSNRDYPLVMGVTLLFAFFLIMINTLVDVAYGIIDPRMRNS
jgi:dipeptide transport system permease protein